MPNPNTPYLVRVQGVPIWCAATSNVGWAIDDGLQSGGGRQADGSMIKTAVYNKRTVDCKTIPYSSDDAYALTMLVEGCGIALPFDAASFVSSKGTFPTGSATWIAGYGTSGPIAGACKYGAGSVSLGSSQSLVYSNLTGVISSTMGITVNLWAKLPAGATQFIDVSPCDISIACGANPAAGLSLSYASNLISSAAITWQSGWNMITAVVRNPGGAYPCMVLYFNGVNVGNGGPVSGSYLGNALSTITVGGAGAVAIDEVAVMPFALNDAMVASIYQQQQQMGALPQVYVDGDGVREAITATGRVSNNTYSLGQDGQGNFSTVARMLEFMLQEV